MSIVLLDATEDKNPISERLRERLQQAGSRLEFFKLKDMDIQPCRSCGACGFISPGKCVVKDDSHKILKAIAESDVFFMLTPIRFGGYNSILKKAVDKFMNLCLPSYMIKDGRLLHPDRYGKKYLVAIGIDESATGEQGKSFRRLVENNALNLNAAHKAIVHRASEDYEVFDQEIDKLLKGVC